MGRIFCSKYFDPDVDLKLYVQSEEEKEAWISALTEAQVFLILIVSCWRVEH